MNGIIKDDIEDRSQHPEKLSETCSNLWHRMLFSLKEKLPLDRPEDFNQLGKLSMPKGYMGLIYADGNDMGKILGKAEFSSEVETFSNVVDNNGFMKPYKKQSVNIFSLKWTTYTFV